MKGTDLIVVILLSTVKVNLYVLLHINNIAFKERETVSSVALIHLQHQL